MCEPKKHLNFFFFKTSRPYAFMPILSSLVLLRYDTFAIGTKFDADVNFFPFYAFDCCSSLLHKATVSSNNIRNGNGITTTKRPHETRKE
jgi:hypothetical protein